MLWWLSSSIKYWIFISIYINNASYADYLIRVGLGLCFGEAIRFKCRGLVAAGILLRNWLSKTPLVFPSYRVCHGFRLMNGSVSSNATSWYKDWWLIFQLRFKNACIFFICKLNVETSFNKLDVATCLNLCDVRLARSLGVHSNNTWHYRDVWQSVTSAF